MPLDNWYKADMSAKGGEQERWDTRFQIKYSNSVFGDANQYCRYFTIKSDAHEYAETIRNRFPCVWLLERGSYGTNDTGSRRKSWINIWWSPAVVQDWGDPPDQGWGRPIHMRSSVRYQPEPPVLSPNLDDLE
jgi:hypothetical protein